MSFFRLALCALLAPLRGDWAWRFCCRRPLIFLFYLSLRGLISSPIISPFLRFSVVLMMSVFACVFHVGFEMRKGIGALLVRFVFLCPFFRSPSDTLFIYIYALGRSFFAVLLILVLDPGCFCALRACVRACVLAYLFVLNDCFCGCGCGMCGIVYEYFGRGAVGVGGGGLYHHHEDSLFYLTLQSA